MESINHDTEKQHKAQEQLIARLDGEVADFFKVDSIKPEIITYKSKKDLHNAWVKAGDHNITEAPNWLVAFATHGKDVHILSGDTMPPSTLGEIMDGQTRFKKTLKHEITHLYQNLINNNAPSWLNEGVSLFVAEQSFYKKMQLNELSIDLLDELDSAMTDVRTYKVGINMVNQIMKHFDKEKLFELIAIKNKNNRYIELQKMFTWLK